MARGASFWARFRGLMGRAALRPGEGLYLPATSIHMLFMRFPIDALFLAAARAGGEQRVVAVRPGLRPWRGIVLPVRGAAGVVELRAGALEAAGVRVGDAVRFEEAGVRVGDVVRFEGPAAPQAEATRGGGELAAEARSRRRRARGGAELAAEAGASRAPVGGSEEAVL